MLTTLDHLEHHIHHRQKKSFFSSFWKDIKWFSIFFLIVFILNSVFVNAQLYQEAIMDIVHQLSWSTNTNTKNSVIWSFISSHHDDLLDKDFIQKKMKLDQITQSINNMTTVKANDFVWEQITNNNLQANLNSYNLDFNLLPPTDRVIIPTINVNTPLLLSSFNRNIDDITKEDFDKDLYKWVVQYPTTPHAGAGWNTLIFWHTSYESWKKNPYATIFSGLPKLKQGDMMQVIQNGKLYEYEVIWRSIVAPSKVNEEYLKYTKWNYLTLLGCYPIWSDKQRILIIGKLKEI
jgi:LPXTG-site transpeptidase (sortase) family protein